MVQETCDHDLSPPGRTTRPSTDSATLMEPAGTAEARACRALRSAPRSSPSSDSIAPTLTGTNSATGQFGSFASRTHRTWTPKYGRVQKCDFCNCRSPGTLHVCTTCTLHICEACSRSGRWHSDGKHFIDPDACDWTEKKIKRKRGAQRRDTMRDERSNRGTPQPRSALAASSRESPGWTSSTKDDTDYDDDEYNGNGDNSPDGSNRAPKHPRLPLPSIDRLGPTSVPASHSHAHSGRAAQASPAASSRDEDGYHARITAAATRPNVRQMAAQALARMSQPDRHVQPSTNDGDDDNDEDENVNGQKGVNGNVNDRRGDLAPSMTGSAAHGTSHNPISTPARPDTSASRTTNQSPEAAAHDQLVLDIYQHIYGHRPERVPSIRTAIPIRWDGDTPPQPQPQPQPRQEDIAWQQHYERFHQYVHDMINHFQHPGSLGPPPPGYENYSFHNYPQYPEPPHTAAQRYLAPVRTTPRFHPYNELLPSELELLHNDRQTLREMLRAWTLALAQAHCDIRFVGVAVPHLAGMRRAGRHAEALQLLWDVFELRRTRVDVRDYSQTVRWFVGEKRVIAVDEAEAKAEGKERVGGSGGGGGGGVGGVNGGYYDGNNI
ncbi:hypothetical protein MFIFM68171_01355 [Madurella fahalii]|uniref:Uncharacterized protein n=1 Tax=Madurella fahalii TaxID=1157608 RepID=A0ABQ0G0R8_9PEZI